MLKKLGVFEDFSDHTIKSVFDAGENHIIEVSLLANKEKMDVVCVPTHHFCNLGCKMCHLTNKGLNKQMTPITIDHFYEALVQTLTKQNGSNERRTNKKKLLISFMGVGEPLLNLELIQAVYDHESDIKKRLGYEDVSYAVSTMMPSNRVLELTKMVNESNIPLKLHFSLHTPIEENRNELIPATRVTIEEALTCLMNYRETVQKNEIIMEKYQKFHRTCDPIEIHYTLIDGVNDGNEELKQICTLLQIYKIPIKFIRFNPIHELKLSHRETEWIQTIQASIPDLRVKTYSPPGREIGSSCGEFTKHYYHEEIETEAERQEFEQWKQHHQIWENARTDYLSWDEYFMAIAALSAMRSKDPNTQVGACIVGNNNKILSIGYNGAPNGYDDKKFPWQRKGEALEVKYPYVVHAEENAILNYQGSRIDFVGSKIYVVLFPCNECAKAIIQSGIKEVIYLSDQYADSEGTIASKRLFDECGISYHQLEKEHQKVLTISLKI